MRHVINIFNTAFKREWQIYMQNKGEWIAPLLFYILICSLFPIAMGPITKDLKNIAPCIIWVAALLASLLAQDSLFRVDYNNGVLEQCIIGSQSLNLIIIAKVIANWAVTGLPLVILTPFVAISFGLPLQTIFVLCVTLLLGTPSLSLLAAFGTALTISLPRGGLLLAIIVLPLYMPILVLGTSAGIMSLQGLNNSGQVALLGAILLAILLGTPFAISSAIKASLT